MAEGSYEINAYGANVKVRRPWAVALLTVVTLGFYNWYWYYKINRELRDFGKVYRLERCENTNPWLSLLAVSLGALLIVPAIVSWVRCTRRIQDCQRVLSQEPMSGWAVGLLFVGGIFINIAWIAIPFLVQDALNKIWAPFEGIDPNTVHDPAQTPISVGAIEMLPRARAWDTSAVSADDHNAITHFLLRRDGLDASTRVRLAGGLAGRLRPLVPDADPSLEPERLLELLAATRSAPLS
jgi:hypothetical protein